MIRYSKIRGIVFDLDGTLVDSRLDFDAMRLAMGLPEGTPILEALSHLDPARASACRAILDEHELAGACRAALLPGVTPLLSALNEAGIRQAIATRNSRSITQRTLENRSLQVDFAFTRDDGPVKPDPWAASEACRRWELPPSEVVVIGDYRFDIECGRAAGCHTVLLTDPADPATYANTERADLLLRSLADYERLLAWLKTL
jgi:HAD superfamily hydrolase (TIGR01509 family)